MFMIMKREEGIVSFELVAMDDLLLSREVFSSSPSFLL